MIPATAHFAQRLPGRIEGAYAVSSVVRNWSYVWRRNYLPILP